MSTISPDSASASISRRPAYRQIAEGLRSQIVRGEYRPGAKLPSTDDLAVVWKSTNFTVHSALTTLVKEGWIERVNGTGTFVAERPHLFRCAGIYHATDIWSDETRQFTRNIHRALERKLREKSRTMENFTDPRPTNQTSQMLPTLTDAIEHRRIDCLIGVTTDPQTLPVFDKLRVPTASVASSFTRHRVTLDHDDMFEKAARSLAEQGCRTAGAITTVCANPAHKRTDFLPNFRQALRRQGVSTREEWLLQPPQNEDDGVPYGYTQFQNFWNQPQKPDGLFVFSDLAVRGVIIAALAAGTAAYQGLKFAFHRNAHTQMLCPFPATWIVSDEDLIAEGLITMIERQFAGETIEPVELPYTVRHEPFVLR